MWIPDRRIVIVSSSLLSYAKLVNKNIKADRLDKAANTLFLSDNTLYRYNITDYLICQYRDRKITMSNETFASMCTCKSLNVSWFLKSFEPDLSKYSEEKLIMLCSKLGSNSINNLINIKEIKNIKVLLDKIEELIKKEALPATKLEELFKIHPSHNLTNLVINLNNVNYFEVYFSKNFKYNDQTHLLTYKHEILKFYSDNKLNFKNYKSLAYSLSMLYPEVLYDALEFEDFYYADLKTHFKTGNKNMIITHIIRKNHNLLSKLNFNKNIIKLCSHKDNIEYIYNSTKWAVIKEYCLASRCKLSNFKNLDKLSSSELSMLSVHTQQRLPIEIEDKIEHTSYLENLYVSEVDKSIDNLILKYIRCTNIEHGNSTFKSEYIYERFNQFKKQIESVEIKCEDVIHQYRLHKDINTVFNYIKKNKNDVDIKKIIIELDCKNDKIEKLIKHNIQALVEYKIRFDTEKDEKFVKYLNRKKLEYFVIKYINKISLKV